MKCPNHQDVKDAKIAIIDSGPAGLSCTYHLANSGGQAKVLGLRTESAAIYESMKIIDPILFANDDHPPENALVFLYYNHLPLLLEGDFLAFLLIPANCS